MNDRGLKKLHTAALKETVLKRRRRGRGPETTDRNVVERS